ncbi:MAG TPA: holo-ACP synthase [Candidatus Binatia bacterium]|nr:holo-ACP synthase [Candidatus Binatia bacterium]
MVSVGVDIVEVERIRRAIGRWGPLFLEKVFTPAEIAYCRGKAREAESFAVRFAAKEAFAKALKVGKASVWQEVEVVRSESPRPALALAGTALALAGSRRVDVSLSHIPTYAVAVVLVED